MGRDKIIRRLCVKTTDTVYLRLAARHTGTASDADSDKGLAGKHKRPFILEGICRRT